MVKSQGFSFTLHPDSRGRLPGSPLDSSSDSPPAAGDTQTDVTAVAASSTNVTAVATRPDRCDRSRTPTPKAMLLSRNEIPQSQTAMRLAVQCSYKQARAEEPPNGQGLISGATEQAGASAADFPEHDSWTDLEAGPQSDHSLLQKNAPDPESEVDFGGDEDEGALDGGAAEHASDVETLHMEPHGSQTQTTVSANVDADADQWRVRNDEVAHLAHLFMVQVHTNIAIMPSFTRGDLIDLLDEAIFAFDEQGSFDERDHRRDDSDRDDMF